MTRLKADDIVAMSAWPEYERRLSACTGESLFSLAARTVGLTPEVVAQGIHGLRVAAVPISSGEGRISGFAESLALIAAQLDFTAAVMVPDEAGFVQARREGYDLVIWADDDTYLAENLHSGFQAENGRATGAGFATALLCLRRIASMQTTTDVKSPVVILGCGPVGLSGARTVLASGADVVLCDLDTGKARQSAELLYAETGREAGWCTAADLSSASEEIPVFSLSGSRAQTLPRMTCLLDAAPTDGCFPLARLEAGACIAAPCVPCSWPASFRLWHDPLQLGTAVMLLAAALERRI